MPRRAYLIGHPTAHSISPAIHNAAFEACGIDAAYEAVDVPPSDLARWVLDIRRQHLLGFNVTVPHKETIVGYLDGADGDASRCGAVNTVVVDRSNASLPRLRGTNTDAAGFRRSLVEEAATTLGTQRVLLLGAGGAARAVALVALRDGASALWVVNRTPERADRLLKELSSVAGATACRSLALADPDLSRLFADATVVVNATSVGLGSGGDTPSSPPPSPPLGGRGSDFRAGTLVVDLVYNPPRTAFLEAAERCGARILGGLGMLVYQAAAAFELWTGQPPPVGVMRAAAEQALAPGVVPP